MSKLESMVWGPLAATMGALFTVWLCVNVYMMAIGE